MTRPPLTPTQDLILEVLAARARLGEPWWHFERSLRRHVKALADAGLVGWDYGNTDGVVRVWLTAAGKDAYLSADYVNPVERRVQDLADDFTDVSGLRWWHEQAKRYGIDPAAIFAIAGAAQESIREWGRLLPDDHAVQARRDLAGQEETRG